MATRAACKIARVALRLCETPVACSSYKPVSYTWNSKAFSNGSVASGKRLLSFSCVVQNDEVERAKQAAKDAKNRPPEPTIFTKIINKEIPAKIVYEDDQCLAFEDVAPQAPCHVLVIPKRQIPMLSDATENDAALLGHLMVTAKRVAEIKNLSEGFRIVINNGEHGSQSVHHLHIHVLGGQQMGWPPF